MTMNIKYHLVPPINQRANNSERAMQKFKNHFIAGLRSIDKKILLRFWDRLLQEATIILNLLRQSRTLPHISAYAHIFGEFDFKRTSLCQPGTRVVMHNRPNDCALWDPNGEYGWYIGPAMEHYRCQKSYIPKTRAERILDTVEFPTKTFHMPQIYSMD